MGTIRHFFRHRPALAALLLAAALCLKALVPTGYMPTASETGTVVMLCSGTTMTVEIPVKGAHPDNGATTADHPCAFAPLSAALTGADFAPLVLAALAFVFVAAILRRDLALPATGARIRPPSQAPPRFI
ncbi:hypothetical protein QUC32_23545 [Novosphingobium resinovorum]|uniref:DUF2946 domain-containing protein n=1 Tax=Novosphingobium resinovorum TaxID=158500 RepID=A0A031JVP2_9SPHN|nr:MULTISPECIES: hypothetical protein [Sphingomonadaceae]AOR77166.1 hypothetical protein BES08_10695 [Novosphingobium resinovorum]EJU11604.1 hypothetical protein LH128_18012 [Sphingomonas sp. LH128]EZP80848.1 hypothetical protein BV97_03271 [Novosphingobium resinovorum]WJM27360.1 hypothetical protein QUC32_23545 [Novosphingobium resinovorum]